MAERYNHQKGIRSAKVKAHTDLQRFKLVGVR